MLELPNANQVLMFSERKYHKFSSKDMFARAVIIIAQYCMKSNCIIKKLKLALLKWQVMAWNAEKGIYSACSFVLSNSIN